MPIEVRCDHCGRLIRAPDRLAGKRCRCPECQGVIAIAVAKREDEYTLAPLDPALEPPPVVVEPPKPKPVPAPRPKPPAAQPVAAPLQHVGLTPRRSPSAPAPLAPVATKLPPGMTWKQWLAMRRRDAIRRTGQPRFFIFAATLLPLALTLLFDPSATRQRLERTLESHPEVAAELERAGSLDAALELLPERRIEGRCCRATAWLTGCMRWPRLCCSFR